MKITLLQDFTAQTTTGPRLLPAGKTLDLSPDKAATLIAAEIAEPVDLPRPYLDTAGELVIPVNAPARFKWWAGGQSATETLKEMFEERAAIMEFDGGLTREEADRQARKITGYQPSDKKTSNDNNHDEP